MMHCLTKIQNSKIHVMRAFDDQMKNAWKGREIDIEQKVNNA